MSAARGLAVRPGAATSAQPRCGRESGRRALHLPPEGGMWRNPSSGSLPGPHHDPPGLDAVQPRFRADGTRRDLEAGRIEEPGDLVFLVVCIEAAKGIALLAGTGLEADMERPRVASAFAILFRCPGISDLGAWSSEKFAYMPS